MTKHWGRNDQAVTANSTTTTETSNGAPIGTYALVKKGGNVSGAPGSANAHFGNTSPGSRANVDSNMFGNTTVGAFIPGMAVGVFGVSAKMEGIVDSPLVDAQVNFHGSGYFANATVTLSGGGGGSSGVINAQANSFGYISNLNISANGSAYKGVVTLAIAAPTAQTFNANTSLFSAQTYNANTSLYQSQTFKANSQGVVANAILLATQSFSVNDALTYTVSAGNTAVSPLVNGHVYYTVVANSTAVVLAAIPGGAQIALTAGGNEQGHTLTHYNFFYAGSTNPFANGTAVKYTVAAGNTAVSPLTAGNTYYTVLANSIGFALSNTFGGAVVNVVPGVSETGHTLTRYSFISVGSSVYQTGDKVTYLVAAGNTAVSPLANNTKYFVQSANSSGFYLANSTLYKSGGYLNLTPGVTESGHSVTGETATGSVTLGALATGALTHAGWVVRREGTGGRAGRVHYETLVAMGSLGAQSASYGTPALVANTGGVANSVFPSGN